MKAIGSWILLTIAVVITVILVGIFSVILSNLFSITPVFVASTYTYQYTLYLNRYRDCLQIADYYSFDPSVCNIMGEMANNTLKTMTDTAAYIQKYGFDNPFVWLLIIVIIIAIVYAVGLIGIQLREK
jgi:amino acid transporter